MKVWPASTAGIAVIALLFSLACSASGPEPEVLTLTPAQPDVAPLQATVDVAPDSLQALGASHSLRIGASLISTPLREDAAYRDAVAREFSIVTVESALKLGLVRREPSEYTFGPADSIVDFARHQGQTVRGHTLVWHEEVPDWLDAADLDREAAMVLLEQHIKTVVGRYAGLIQEWDVVNEAIDDDGELRDTVWLRLIGPEYIALAFQWAHEADPDARLFYNDYNIEWSSPKSDAAHDLLAGLLESGVPVHGIGFQGHFTLDWFPSTHDMAMNFERFADLGLEIQLTEVDVRLEVPITDEKLEAQADIYWQLMAVCMEQPACTTFITWGVSDRYSWIPDMRPGFDAGLLLDVDYEPKPAYWALIDALTRPPGEPVLPD